MIYRRYSLKEIEQGFHQIWQSIKATLQQTLDSRQLSWFDDNSREAALEKLHRMQLYIASYEDMNLDELYKDLKLNSSDYIENIKSILSYTAKLSRTSLEECMDDKHRDINDISPSYTQIANAVRFPISSLLTDYMWSKHMPQAINYGRLGTMTGHEIMHGFSGQGRYFNNIGIFFREGIYKDNEQNYELRRQCYYNQYTYLTSALPQEHSQEENLCDNGAMYLAYHAYLQWLEDERRTPEELDMESLRHLNYTNKQLYFIGYSQAWCSESHPDGWFERMTQNTHAPDMFRVNVPLSNFGEFAKEFNCPLGSRMNPYQKCSIY